MIIELVTNLKEALGSSLPGKIAQQKMAPNIRNIEALLKKIPSITKESGVMVLLYPVDDSVYMVLIKRPDYDGPHGGQVSLPGGKFEDIDNDLIETALREAEEEIGIPKHDIQVIGQLTPLYIPVSGSQVLPVVGWVDYKPVFKPDPKEVEHIIETPVFTLIDPSVSKIETIQIQDRVIDAPYFDINNYHVWGATAMMLSELREVLYEIRFNQE